MTASEKTKKSSSFYLSKWYLDFIGENGEAMIFYAAELIWHGIKIPFANQLHCNLEGEILQKSRFRSVRFPEIGHNEIIWQDSGFDVKGSWLKHSPSVEARVFESEEGHLDWYCFQPASVVTINKQGQIFNGGGYAEKLTLTLPVWKIPMDELRWGHVLTKNHQLVWIEIKSSSPQKWLWLNGEFMNTCTISDELIQLPEANITVRLKRKHTLEAEKKLKSLADKMVRFIPGINALIPTKFLLADENKWLSTANVYSENKLIDQGYSIHEYVDLNTPSS